jgi:hypothetical protein
MYIMTNRDWAAGTYSHTCRSGKEFGKNVGSGQGAMQLGPALLRVRPQRCDYPCSGIRLGRIAPACPDIVCDYGDLLVGHLCAK